MPRLTLLLLAGLLLTGCAQSLPAAERAALDRSVGALDAQLTPAGQLAAAAALVAERTGTFPQTPFALLGAPAAAEMGARQLNLSALDVQSEGNDFRLAYTLLPTREDPTRRSGELLLTPTAAEGQYEARVSLSRMEDPDHGGRSLDLHREDNVAVRQLGGRFCVDLAADPTGVGPTPERPYTITFTPAPGTAGNAYREIAEGYTLTVDG